jgi:predicted Zn-dependent protease
MHSELEKPLDQEIEQHIETVAALTAEQQGISFFSHREAQRHLDNVRAEVRSAFKHSNAALNNGLRYLKEMNCGYVSTVSAKLLKHMHSSKKLAALISQEIEMRSDAAEQFIEAVNRFYDWEDNQTVMNAVAVLMRLFPLHPQPYIYLGTLIWRQNGIEAAVAYYGKIVEAIDDPALGYFAADCLYKSGDVQKAKQLLLRALDNEVTSSEVYADVRQNIIELLECCLLGGSSQ